MNTIQQEWESFRDEVIPDDAPNIQIIEMRRAFYAGAQAVLNLQIAITGPEISEDAGAAIIEGWHDELRIFADQVRKGKA